MKDNQYTQKSIPAINAAQALASEYGNQELSQAHLLAALTGAPVEALTGRGGGLTDSAQAKAQASCDPQGFLSHNDSDYRTSKVSKIYRSAPRRSASRPLP